MKKVPYRVGQLVKGRVATGIRRTTIGISDGKRVNATKHDFGRFQKQYDALAEVLKKCGLKFDTTIFAMNPQQRRGVEGGPSAEFVATVGGVMVWHRYHNGYGESAQNKVYFNGEEMLTSKLLGDLTYFEDLLNGNA